MPKSIKTLVIAFITLALFAPVAAGAQDQPFSQAELNKLIEDLPGFISLVQRKEAEYRNLRTPGALQAYMGNRDLNAFLQSRNWRPGRFYVVLSRVMSALSTAVLAHQSPALQAQLEAQRQSIKNSALSPDEKQAALQQLNQAMSEVQQLQDPQDTGLTDKEIKMVAEKREALMEKLGAAD
jgi:hypothetical protein